MFIRLYKTFSILVIFFLIFDTFEEINATSLSMVLYNLSRLHFHKVRNQLERRAYYFPSRHKVILNISLVYANIHNPYISSRYKHIGAVQFQERFYIEMFYLFYILSAPAAIFGGNYLFIHNRGRKIFLSFVGNLL